jgi:hypothetical protein
MIPVCLRRESKGEQDATRRTLVMTKSQTYGSETGVNLKRTLHRLKVETSPRGIREERRR